MLAIFDPRGFFEGPTPLHHKTLPWILINYGVVQLSQSFIPLVHLEVCEIYLLYVKYHVDQKWATRNFKRYGEVRYF